MDLEKHLTEITRLRREADSFPDDNPAALMQKIEILAKCMVYVGRVSSYLDGEYKRIYAERKRKYAEAYIKAPRSKEAHAELAVADLREIEAKAYEDSRRWRNAFDSLTEEIHALKLKMRVDFATEVADYVRIPSSTKDQAQTR